MKSPEIPKNESIRLASLHGLNILDTPNEERFDRITRIAKQYFDTPVALVSLVDRERQWFKSRQGLEVTETPREISFCGHAILDDATLYVPDALRDERFVNNPLVIGKPNIRFYAGAPLHSPDGERVGTLCVIDFYPREFYQDELRTLRDLADCVENELARTRLSSDLEESKQQVVMAKYINTGGIIANNEGTIIWVNQRFERMTDYTLAQVNGVSLVQFFRELGMSGESCQLMAERISLAEAFNAEFLIDRKDHDPYWLAINLQAIRDEHGRLVNYIVTVNDITDRKLNELQAQAEEKRIRAIVDSVIDGIVFINTQGIIQIFNPASEKMFGYESEEVIGHSVSILMPEPYQSAHDGFINNYLMTGIRKVVGVSREVVGLRKDGSTFPMEVALNEIEFKGERMFTGTMRDITDRVIAQQQVRESEQRVKAIVSDVIDGIIENDTKESKTRG